MCLKGFQVKHESKILQDSAFFSFKKWILQRKKQNPICKDSHLNNLAANRVRWVGSDMNFDSDV